MVWPTTPEENNGGISIDKEDPIEEEESRRARLLPEWDSMLLVIRVYIMYNQKNVTFE